MTTELKDLELAVKLAQKEFDKAVQAVEKFKSLPENNVYEVLDDDLEYELEEALTDRASNDCEGAGNCGQRVYTQLFFVKDVLYKAILTVEYNRHDKTYYYVDETDFKIEKVGV